MYIGDFRVRNCRPYGSIGIIKQLKENDPLVLQYDVSEKLIVVKAKTTTEKKDGATGELKKVEKWITIGELDVPGCLRTVIVPLLLGKHSEELFECQLADNNLSVNHSFTVSVWAEK